MVEVRGKAEVRDVKGDICAQFNTTHNNFRII